MGGVWTTPLKLVDGVWFALDGQWIGPATTFTSGWGYTRYTLPDTDGLHVERTDFAPDGERAAVFALVLRNPAAKKRSVRVRIDAHSELMSAYPWGSTTPSQADFNLPDHGTFTGRELQFTDQGTPPGGPAHDWAAFVASTRTPIHGEAAETGGTYRGDQGDTVCPASDNTSPPSACDDGPYGKGTGGMLEYKVRVPARGATRVWFAVAGSDRGVDDARAQLTKALDAPTQQLADKIAARTAVGARSVVSLPGDATLARAIDWGKQNLADATQTASDLQIRWTNQGKQYPDPLGTVASARWFAAGFPDYPWIFATDGVYDAFAAVALGQFETAKAHLIALRDISEVLNGGSGIVVHEVVPDGSVYFGHDSVTTKDDGTKVNDFNTDETIKFPSAVALIWRWTGDNAFRDELYDFSVRALKAVDSRLDVDQDGWPEGSGNVERPGMGPEKLDNAVYYLRALVDLSDMARSKGDTTTARWADALAGKISRSFESTWWDAAASQYADSLIDPGNQQSFQKHWIGEVPMEAELDSGNTVMPGVASADHAVTALGVREGDCYSGSRPGSLGLFHTGCGGGADGKGDFEIFSLTTAIQAVGEGNYGRLGAGQQQRYTDANAETMFSEPATGGEPDEQPGAMPEIFPSAPGGDPSAGIPANIDRCWTCRSMVMQSWGNYGTAWPVVHQQLGVRPFLNNGQVQVVPQVPDGQPSVAGSNIRLGDSGSIDVFASRDGNTWTTKVDATRTPGSSLVIGATLPALSRVLNVTLDGAPITRPFQRTTNRGLEVTVSATPGQPHTLVVQRAA
jgi:hypothetical protein